MDVATNVLTDNQGAPEQVRWQVNRAAAAKLFSRRIGFMLLIVGGTTQGVHTWVITLLRCWAWHILA